MARFRQVHLRLWRDPKVKSLPPDAKLVFIYLITNPQTHFSGIYELPEAIALRDLNLDSSTYQSALRLLRDQSLVSFDEDTETIWVRNMLRYQARRNAKTAKGVATQLESLHGVSLKVEFTRYYDTWSIPPRYPFDTPSIQGDGDGDGNGDGEESSNQVATPTSGGKQRAGSSPPISRSTTNQNRTRSQTPDPAKPRKQRRPKPPNNAFPSDNDKSPEEREQIRLQAAKLLRRLQ